MNKIYTPIRSSFCNLTIILYTPKIKAFVYMENYLHGVETLELKNSSGQSKNTAAAVLIVIQNAATDAIQEIEKAKIKALSSVETAQYTAMGNINTAGVSVLDDINTSQIKQYWKFKVLYPLP